MKIRKPTSLPGRIERFFTDNPDEELTHLDIVAKFGCSEHAARQAVAKLRGEGLLESLFVIRNRSKGIAR